MNLSATDGALTPSVSDPRDRFVAVPDRLVQIVAGQTTEVAVDLEWVKQDPTLGK